MESIKSNDAHWFNKISLTLEENEDGSLNMTFEWDENDPELQLWTELSEETKKEIILSGLRESTTEE